MIRNVDYLIVGQGMAGSCIAFELLKAGQTVAVVDQGPETAASTVGAGIMNPLVFRYITQSWKAAEYFEKAKAYYSSFEAYIEKKLLFKLPVLRLLGDGEAVNWAVKAGQANIGKWTNGEVCFPINKEFIAYPHGAVSVEAARLDMGLLTSSVKTFLIANGAFLKEDFDLSLPLHLESGIAFKGGFAKNVIFCEGFHAKDNPLFDFVPFRPVKGELLTLHIPGLESRHIINRDVFILPVGDQLFRVGSNYDWDDLTLLPTEMARKVLLEKLDLFLKLPYKVVGHQAGIRPSVADRRPVIGRHPDFDNIFILNGLGAKGAMLAPAMAQQLASLLLYNIEVDSEVDIRRFRK
jgi:glycine oxidase